ncbi:MAG: ROK family protein [Acidobacteria bacterium]|nr:MAG: ROK family protein [Acidobacteriota bacterium]
MPKNALVGVDVGGTKTAVLISLGAPSVLARIEFPTKPARGPEPALRLIHAGIRDLLAKHRLKPVAIGVSCGGPLDHIAGVIQAPPNLSTWKDVPIKAMLEDEFGVTCHVENDANAGAVAEHRFGAGRGCRNMVFLTMGTGLGAGIITDGRLYHGTNDFAGEIGHVRLTRSGPVGYHKAGSVEGWASGGGMTQIAEKAVKGALKRKEPTTLAVFLQQGKPITARDVALAAGKGDVVAARILRSTGKRLGATLAILVDILNPERIVIGGLAMRLGETLLRPAREVLEREALPYSTAVCKVVPAQLDERIGDVAALCVAMGF